MPLDWSPLVDLVRRHQRFLLTTHIRPDGDAIGSILGMDAALRHHGKDVRLVVDSHVAARYHFLDPEGRIEHFEPPGDTWRRFAEVAIVLDTSAWSQLGKSFGPFFRGLTIPKVVIDHHRTQDDLGALRLVDVTAEATGRLVVEATRALGSPLTPAAADALFVALVMDTGWFQHNNTTAATFALAEELVAAGARRGFLHEMLFERNTLGRLKLMGLTLDRLQVTHGGKTAWTEIRQADYAATGATPMDSEDLVNFTRSIAGVEVGLLFLEQPRGGIKVSFRSREAVDVAQIAEQFGGGGHRAAAGVVLDPPMEQAQARVLQAVAAALDAAR